MMGVATDPSAQINITDMDQIEVSNLDRQFLFRRNDVGGKKSECAAKVVKKFNADLNITVLSDRVAEDTEAVFNDEFFEDFDAVTNVLDNLDARRYIDRRGVYYRLPLLESGTMGTKGNTQVVYPHVKTLKDEKVVELRFPAPQKPGVYAYTLHVRSDSYFDIDVATDVKLEVRPAPEFIPPKYVEDEADDDAQDDDDLSEYTEGSDSDESDSD